MLKLTGNRPPMGDGLSRRSFLQIGGLAMGGLSLPQVLQAQQQSGESSPHKAVIMIFLAGGLVLFVTGARIGSDVPFRIGRRLGRAGIEDVPVRERLLLALASVGGLLLVLIGLWLVLRGVTLLLID